MMENCIRELLKETDEPWDLGKMSIPMRAPQAA